MSRRRATQRAGALLCALALAGLVAACGEDDPDAPQGSAVGRDDGSTSTTGSQTSGGDQETAAAGSLDQARLALTEIGQFDTPISLVSRADDTALFVVERDGRVLRLDVSGEGADRSYEASDEPLLDISDRVVTEGERGLLDVEFSPDGARLYVSFSLAPDGDSRVESYAYDGTAIDPASRREILTVGDFAENHNGGDLEFGPDGYLYVAMGDGGGAGDPESNGQDTGALLGKILRIDPEGATGNRPYAIPADNPFADGNGGAPEVWLYGVRNPWRFGFDRETDDLWIGDVGQGAWEEIDFLPASDGAGRGANLGWSDREGSHPFEGGSEPEGAIPPIYEYPNGEDGACAITGGWVYRGSAIPELRGSYVFGDYCTSPLRAIQVSGGRVAADRIFEGADVSELVSFGEDNDGELYAVSLSGSIYRLDPA